MMTKKVFPALFMAGFVLTTVLALFLVLIEQQVFSAQTIKNMLINNHFYEMFPAILAEQAGLSIPGRPADGQVLADIVQGLSAEQKKQAFSVLLPPLDTQIMLEEWIDSAQVLVDGSQTKFSSKQLKKIIAINGLPVLEQIIQAKPACHSAQLQAIATTIHQGWISDPATAFACRPTQTVSNKLHTLLQSEMARWLAAFPDEIDIMSSEGSAAQVAGQLQLLARLRWVVKFSPTIPLFFLSLVIFLPGVPGASTLRRLSKALLLSGGLGLLLGAGLWITGITYPINLLLQEILPSLSSGVLAQLIRGIWESLFYSVMIPFLAGAGIMVAVGGGLLILDKKRQPEEKKAESPFHATGSAAPEPEQKPSLAKYTLLELVSTDHASEVYHARDTLLNRDVLLRRIKSESLNDSATFERAIRRARLAAQLQHPNIAQLLEYGQEDGISYLSMRYVPGKTVDNYLQKRGYLPLRDAIQMVHDISHALDYAHERGILHRYILPDKIILSDTGEFVLTDFGVTEVCHYEDLQNYSNAMKPAAPEILAGKSATQKTDQYDLAYLMVKSLTGEAWLGTLDAAPMLEGIPPKLTEILLRALSDDPKNRFPGMLAFSAACTENIPQETSATNATQHAGGRRWKTYWIELIRQKNGKIGLLLAGFFFLIGVLIGGFGRNGNFPSLSQVLNPISTRLSQQLSVTVTLPTNVSTPTPISTPSATPDPTAGMILIPGGTFKMGSLIGDSNEQPVHEVTLSSFYLDKFEVTNAQYKLCVASGTCQPPVQSYSRTRDSYYDDPIYTNFPVIYVNWQMARAYCEWRGARLSTEAEWEYASRGVDGRRFSWGNTIDSGNANYQNDKGDTLAVGSYEKGKSSFGVYDMTGNIAEWVDDAYTLYEDSPVTNPLETQTGLGRVVRGGSWNDPANDVRSANRIGMIESTASGMVGFRCAHSNNLPESVAMATGMPGSTPTQNSENPLAKSKLEDEMVRILGGGFWMGNSDGSSDEKPVHKVVLSSFYIDKYEVTNAAYMACQTAGGCRLPTRLDSATRLSYYGNSLYDNYPVINVSWVDADAFCAWSDARLPTEAEWEYAARGPSSSPASGIVYPWGRNADLKFANYAGQLGDTTEVGTYDLGQSPFGVYDLAGNVWEWVDDFYDANYYHISPQNDPMGPKSGTYHVVRGGSWNSVAIHIGSTLRGAEFATSAKNSVGFRCARDADGLAWEFETAGGAEGWEPWSQIANIQINQGMLQAKSTGIDPYLGSPKFILDAKKYPVIKIRLKVASGNNAQLFFITSSESTYSENKSLHFSIIGDDSFHTYVLNMSAVKGWAGTITQIRLDPAEKPSTFEIDYIRLLASE